MRARLRSRSTDHRHSLPWQRDVRLLAISRGVSVAGAEAGYIALLAIAWRYAGSASDATLVLLAATVARIIGAPVAGWIGDRCERRRVIVAAEVGTAIALCLMAASGSLAALAAAAMLHAFATVCCGSALDAAVAKLVPSMQLGRANATLAMARSTGHMLGPMLGGAMIALADTRSALLVDAATSIVAAALMLLVAGQLGGATPSAVNTTSEAPDSVRSRNDDGLLAGARAIAREPVLRCIAVGYAGICAAFAFVSAAELPLCISFGMDEAGLGVIVSSWCGGSLLGAWRARRVRIEHRGASVLVRSSAACAAVLALTGLAPTFSIVVALMFAGGFAMATGDVVGTTVQQQHTDDRVRARVSAAMQALNSTIWGTNLALAGLVVDATSPATAYAIAGAWCIVATAGFAVLARAQHDAHLSFALRIARPRHALESDVAESA